jgi:hypothetical protein
MILRFLVHVYDLGLSGIQFIVPNIDIKNFGYFWLDIELYYPITNRLKLLWIILIHVAKKKGIYDAFVKSESWCLLCLSI